MRYVKHRPDNSQARNPTGISGSPILPPGFRPTPTPGNSPEKELDIAKKICVLVAQKMGVRVSVMRNNVNSAHVVRARDISMSIIRELMTLSYAESGEIHGKTHSTVVGACRRVKALCVSNHDYAQQYQMLLDEARKLLTE